MPLKPLRATVYYPAEIDNAVQTRIKELKFPSMSAYINSLILFDIYARRPHLLTGELMREPQWLRDKVIEELARDFDNPGMKPGGWFECRIRELVKQEKEKGENHAG